MAQQSGLGQLNTRNWLRGLAVAVVTAVLTVIQTSVAAGSLVFNWIAIITVGLTAAIGYILLNLGTNNKGELLTKDVPT